MKKTDSIMVFGAWFLLTIHPQLWASMRVSFQPAKEAIQNLDQTLEGLNKTLQKTQFCLRQGAHQATIIHFPQTIPLLKENIKAYASFSPYGNGYAINIDATANCHGVNFCNLGRLIVQCHTNIIKVTDHTTSLVNLSNGIQGYFTPGLAKADYWPANLQWQSHQRHYTLEWRHLDNQKAFMQMANSLIEGSK